MLTQISTNKSGILKTNWKLKSMRDIIVDNNIMHNMTTSNINLVHSLLR